MPRAYFQCPKCGEGMSTHYKGTKRRKPRMSHGCEKNGGQMTSATYCGDGWPGRGTWPHGNPYKGEFKPPTMGEPCPE